MSDAALPGPQISPAPGGAIGWLILRLTAMADTPGAPGRWTHRLTLLLVTMMAAPDLAALIP